MGKLYENKMLLIGGNCTTEIIFCLFMIFYHNLKKHCFLYAMYGNANKKEVVNQYL